VFISIGPEAQVMLAICAFYLYDACIPLSADAGLLRPARPGWRGLLAAQAFEVRWAYLAWPPLLLPHRPVYRLRWDPARVQLPGDTRAMQALKEHAGSFRGFALPLYGLGFTLFALLPAALFIWPSDAAQLSALALIYGFALWIALLTRRHGRRGHTPLRTARAVAVQAILCPPFALNAVRKLSAAHVPACDLLQAARHVLRRDDWRDFVQRAQAVVDSAMDEAQAENDLERVRQLRVARDRLGER